MDEVEVVGCCIVLFLIMISMKLSDVCGLLIEILTELRKR